MESTLKDPKILIREAKSGDKEAFGKLYKTYYVPVFRYVYLRVNEKQTTEDIVQDVFMKVYRNIINYKEQGKNPLAYFFTVARNTVIDFYRKGKTISLDENLAILERLESRDENPEKTFEQKERARLVSSAIQTLNEVQKEVIILRFINGFDYKQITQILEKKEVAIRQIQHRALKILKHKLEGIL